MKQFKTVCTHEVRRRRVGKEKIGKKTERQRRSSTSGEFNIWLSDLLLLRGAAPASKACSIHLHPPAPSASQQNASTATDHDMLPWRRLLQPVAKAPCWQHINEKTERGRGGRKGGEIHEGGEEGGRRDGWMIRRSEMEWREKRWREKREKEERKEWRKVVGWSEKQIKDKESTGSTDS